MQTKTICSSMNFIFRLKILYYEYKGFYQVGCSKEENGILCCTMKKLKD